MRGTFRNLFAFIAAVLIAPAVFAVGLELSNGLRQGLTLADVAKGVLFFEVFGAPFSCLLGLFFGVPTILIARALHLRAAWIYATGGLVAGSVMAFLDHGRTHGSTSLSESMTFVASGLVAAMTYWAIAGRRKTETTLTSSIFD